MWAPSAHNKYYFADNLPSVILRLKNHQIELKNLLILFRDFHVFCSITNDEMNFIDDRLAFSTVFCTHALSFIYKIHFYIHPRQIILAYSWTAWLLTCRLDYSMYCIIKVLLYNISLHFDFFFLTLKTVVPGGSTPPPFSHYIC